MGPRIREDKGGSEDCYENEPGFGMIFGVSDSSEKAVLRYGDEMSCPARK